MRLLVMVKWKVISQKKMQEDLEGEVFLESNGFFDDWNG